MVYKGNPTIKIFVNTKQRLDKLKEKKGESYDEVISKSLYILNLCRNDLDSARRYLKRIESIRERDKELIKSLNKICQ